MSPAWVSCFCRLACSAAFSLLLQLAAAWQLAAAVGRRFKRLISEFTKRPRPPPLPAGEGGNRSNFGRAPVVRPAPRAFSANEARNQGLQVMNDRFEPGVVVLNSHRCAGEHVSSAGLGLHLNP